MVADRAKEVFGPTDSVVELAVTLTLGTGAVEPVTVTCPEIVNGTAAPGSAGKVGFKTEFVVKGLDIASAAGV